MKTPDILLPTHYLECSSCPIAHKESYRSVALRQYDKNYPVKKVTISCIEGDEPFTKKMSLDFNVTVPDGEQECVNEHFVVQCPALISRSLILTESIAHG